MADIYFVMDNMHGGVNKVMIQRAVRAAETSGLLTQKNTCYKVNRPHRTKPCSCQTQSSNTSVINVGGSSRRASTERSFVQRPRKVYSLRTKSSLSSNICSSCDAYSSAVSGEFGSQRPKKNLKSRTSIKNFPKKNAKFESKSHKSVYNQNKLAHKVTKNKHIRKERQSPKNHPSLMKKRDDYKLKRNSTLSKRHKNNKFGKPHKCLITNKYGLANLSIGSKHEGKQETSNNSMDLEKNKLKNWPSKEITEDLLNSICKTACPVGVKNKFKKRSTKSKTNTPDRSLKKCKHFTRSKARALKEKELRQKSSRKSNSRKNNQSKNLSDWKRNLMIVKKMNRSQPITNTCIPV